MAKTIVPDHMGFRCECGKYHPHPAYIFAHWDIEILHTCDCGRKHSILCGDVELVKESVPSKAVRSR